MWCAASCAADDERPDLQQSRRRGRSLGNVGFNWLGFNRLLDVPVGVLVMIVIAAAGSLVLNRTAFGRWLYASGGNERAAELSGVPVKTVQVLGLCLSRACAQLSRA